MPPFSKGFIINNIPPQAINNGINPQNGKQGGLETGYLKDMFSFEQALEAVRTQFEYFMDWHVTIINILESAGFSMMPVPMVSTTMDGCMENGKDMMPGGAKNNLTGTAILGVGSNVDSFRPSSIWYMTNNTVRPPSFTRRLWRTGKDMICSVSG